MRILSITRGSIGYKLKDPQRFDISEPSNLTDKFIKQTDCLGPSSAFSGIEESENSEETNGMARQ